MTPVTLSLISHTNVGKTSLARTLLRREIGEVRDQPHVTTVAEAHVLIETADARLLLWDTPGFGDTVRLMTRLPHEGDPIGWVLHQSGRSTTRIARSGAARRRSATCATTPTSCSIS